MSPARRASGRTIAAMRNPPHVKPSQFRILEEVRLLAGHMIFGQDQERQLRVVILAELGESVKVVGMVARRPIAGAIRLRR